MKQQSALFLLVSMSVWACGGGGFGKKRGRGDPRTAPSCDQTALDTGAYADLEVIPLGSSGELTIDSFEFEFEWSSEMLVAAGPVFLFDLNADVSGLAATVESAGDSVGFAFWGLNDDVWVDAARADESEGGWWSAPFYHWGGEGVSMAMPIGASTVPDGGGCLFVQPAVLEDRSGDEATLHMVTKAYDAGTGTLDLNIVIVGGAAIEQVDLDYAIELMNRVWSEGGGPSVGTVELFDLSGSSYLDYDDSNELRATVLPDASPQAINLFIIDDYSDEPGTLGEAGGIPGPLGILGVDGAGVIVALDGHRYLDGVLDVRTMAETMAHEVGHQVGLFHTTESDGTSTESLEDTADCPASADNGDGYFTAEECEAYDGRNFMFWITGNFAQDEVSGEQALVLSRSVVTH